MKVGPELNMTGALLRREDTGTCTEGGGHVATEHTTGAMP